MPFSVWSDFHTPLFFNYTSPFFSLTIQILHVPIPIKSSEIHYTIILQQWWLNRELFFMEINPYRGYIFCCFQKHVRNTSDC